MKINEVDKVTTLAPVECITAIAADGSLIQIPVSELAKVMAQVMPIATNEKNGLMSRDGFYFRGTFDYSNTEDVNNLTKSGMYFHGGSIAGSSSLHGILIVFNALPYIAQVDIGGNGVLLYRFSSGSGSNWSTWRQISFT